MNLTSSRITTTDFAAAQETYHSNGWTDGLPVVPPTPELVSACLEWALLSPEHLVGIEPVRERSITAEKLAINAVMAGCLPEHFPLVVTAFTAMLQPEFLLHGATASTGGCAVLLIVNGPIRRQLDMVGTFNALGNTDRAPSRCGCSVKEELGLEHRRERSHNQREVFRKTSCHDRVNCKFFCGYRTLPYRFDTN